MSKWHQQIFELLSHPRITDLCINGPREVLTDVGEGLVKKPCIELDPNAYRQWVLKLISLAGKNWDARHPYIDFTLEQRYRFHVLFPPIVNPHPVISVRIHPHCRIARRWAGTAFEFLKTVVAKYDTVIISGATGCGKTTLLNDLLLTLGTGSRIISLEDTPELSSPALIQMISRTANPDGFGEVTLRDLLRQSLRMRPDRIILGECRGNEVLELLQVLNTGHRGALATLHANSSRDALRRIELLCLLATHGSIPSHAIRELLACGIQWLVHLGRMDGARVIESIDKIEGKERDTILLRPVLKQGQWTTTSPTFPLPLLSLPPGHSPSDALPLRSATSV